MKNIFGIDFSGSADAGNKIWITCGITSKNTLQILSCYPAKDLPHSGISLDNSLKALRDFIASQKECAFGIDFPFSLPSKLVKADSWEKFVIFFNQRFSDANSFRKICWKEAGYREMRRYTDIISHAPFSPYNLRLYRQTYYGIGAILAPLVHDNLVNILPMKKQLPHKPCLLEVCPASTLKRMEIYQPYKNTVKNVDRRMAREYILQEIEKTGIVEFKNKSLKESIINNPGGDALDSIIAALATFRAICNLDIHSLNSKNEYLLEGYIYV